MSLPPLDEDVLSGSYIAGSAPAVVRENSRMVSCMTHLGAGVTMSSSKSPSSRKSHAVDRGLLATEMTTEQYKEAFNEHVESIDQLLELVHGKPAEQQDMTAEELEERRCQREAERRRMLLRQQAARDPRKTIKAKLNIARESAEEGEVPQGAPDIPMMAVDFQTSRGLEKVSLVDVRNIRASCQQVDQRPNVSMLLELQKSRERYDAITRNRKQDSMRLNTPMALCCSAPSLGSASFQHTASVGGPPGRTQERVLQVRARKNNQKFNLTLQKMHALRGDAPEGAMERIEALAGRVMQVEDDELSSVQATPTSADLGSARFRMTPKGSTPKAAFAKGRIGALLSEESVSALRRSMVRGSFLAGCSTHDGSGLARELAEVVSEHRGAAHPGCIDTMFPPTPKSSPSGCANAPPSPGKPKSRFQLMIAKRQAREKALRQWRLLRGVVNVLLWYLLMQRYSRSIERVKAFLRQLGEADRIKFGMHQLTIKLRMINRCCRTYVQKRRKRLAIMNQTWQEVEDRHLGECFQVMAKQLLEDFAPQEGSVISASDWTKFRIPAGERSAVLERFYISQLLKRINTERFYTRSSPVEAMDGFSIRSSPVQSATDGSEKDADEMVMEPTIRRKTIMVEPALLSLQTSEEQAFWMIGEETVLDLIALSAQALSGCEPFRIHPALWKAGGEKSYSNPFRRLVDSSYAGLMYRKQDKSSAANKNSQQSHDNASASDLGEVETAKVTWARSTNVEELIQRFTPRLCYEDMSAASQTSKFGD